VRPAKEFVDALTDEEAAFVVAAMRDVARNGLAAARHLRGEIYEVRADAERQAFRLLFAQETKFISWRSRASRRRPPKTPPDEIALAESRLAEWRRRGRRS